MMADHINRSASPMLHALRVCSPWICSWLVVAACSTPAAAADKTAKPATKLPADRLLTSDQARDCLAQKDRLRAQTDEALKAKAGIATERAQIEERAAALKEEMTTLDRTNADTVAAFNAKVSERDQSIDAYQVKVQAYNTQAANVETARGTYEKSCELRRYDENALKDTPKKK